MSTAGLDKSEYATHSMRRTRAALIYKATGNLQAIQILLGPTSIEHRVRYLGVDVDDALTLSERTGLPMARAMALNVSFEGESRLYQAIS